MKINRRLSKILRRHGATRSIQAIALCDQLLQFNTDLRFLVRGSVDPVCSQLLAVLRRDDSALSIAEIYAGVGANDRARQRILAEILSALVRASVVRCEGGDDSVRRFSITANVWDSALPCKVVSASATFKCIPQAGIIAGEFRGVSREEVKQIGVSHEIRKWHSASERELAKETEGAYVQRAMMAYYQRFEMIPWADTVDRIEPLQRSGLFSAEGHLIDAIARDRVALDSYALHICVLYPNKGAADAKRIEVYRTPSGLYSAAYTQFIAANLQRTALLWRPEPVELLDAGEGDEESLALWS
jgi:hypothetical protein